MRDGKQDLQIITGAVNVTFSEIFVSSWESTLQRTTGLKMNFTVFYVKLVDLLYFR